MPFFTFSNLSPFSWLVHGISTKEFGNLSDRAGRRQEAKKNLDKFVARLKGGTKDLIEMNQVHGNHVAVVGREERGHKILETDAIVTDTSGVVLFVKVADCVPILLADPVKKVVAAVHAGWRGTVQEIVRITVDHMEDHFSTRAKDLIVGIGPSIGPCCYEVDTPVINAFKTFPYHKKLLSKIHGKHANLDLWEANRFQLVERGVEAQNIEVAGLCTYDNQDLFFSDRRIKSQGGRFGGLISIK